jgi:preprotein translocase subunit SecG
MLYYVLVGLYVLVSFLLLVVILLQQGKGGDIAAAFGGASSQTAFGARAGATVLTRATTILGALFLLGAFGLTLIGRNQGGSVVSGVAGPPPAAQPAAPALPPVTTPPPATPPGATPAPASPAPAPGSPAPVESAKPVK